MMKTVLVMSGLVLALSLGACKQKEGEACQTNSDCKGGLVCCFDSSSGKGTCQTECVVIQDGSTDAQQDATVNGDATTDASVMDSAVVDSAVVDGQVSDSSLVDAQVDAMIEDAASLDASVQDDATLQDGSTTDASVDAN
ncbi:MAG: hypothetical protein J7M25_08835 [Deltaproteobacteria bacterium]|nr:hypothetical protein [Deltaproteobacteria bacterium]